MRSNFFIIFLISASATCALASSAPEVMRISQKDMHTNFMKFNEKFNYLSEKLEANTDKISKIEQLLLELIDTVNDKKRNARETKVDVVGDLTSQCNDMCESKVNNWANQTSAQFKQNLESMDFIDNNSTFKIDGKGLNGCDPNPCLSGSRCELTTYRCTECPYLTSGRHCEKLNCTKEKSCWQYKDTMYVVLEEKVTWEKAYNRCVNVGMRLAMPKERDATEFLVTQLKTVYQPAENRYFWLGLKNNASAEYRWIDGTPLEEYTGGMADLKNYKDQRMVIVYLSDPNIFWWPNVGYELHYPICENRIFARI